MDMMPVCTKKLKILCTAWFSHLVCNSSEIHAGGHSCIFAKVVSQHHYVLVDIINGFDEIPHRASPPPLIRSMPCVPILVDQSPHQLIWVSSGPTGPSTRTLGFFGYHLHFLLLGMIICLNLYWSIIKNIEKNIKKLKVSICVVNAMSLEGLRHFHFFQQREQMIRPLRTMKSFQLYYAKGYGPKKLNSVLVNRKRKIVTFIEFKRFYCNVPS